MSCVRVPTSLAEADLVIQACSGVTEWRPVFLLGLGTLGILVALAIIGWLILVSGEADDDA